MRTFRQLCAVFVLVCVLAVSSFAGEMSAGVVPPPPPPAPTQATSEEIEPTVTTDETGGDVIEVLQGLLQTALLMF